jgi:hyperosmotically inducible protein
LEYQLVINDILKHVVGIAVLSTGLLLPAPTVAAQQAPTADKSKNNGADRNLTLQIRRDVVRDKSLSTYAHNIKIIVEKGTVTLKGPVHSDEEKKAILAHAEKHAGQGHVVDQIVVDNK